MSTKTRKNWTLPRDWKLDVTAQGQCPKDAGQIIDVYYLLWTDGCGGGLVIRRTHDRSDGSTTLEASVAGDCFEPWNGIVEVAGDYLPVKIS